MYRDNLIRTVIPIDAYTNLQVSNAIKQKMAFIGKPLKEGKTKAKNVGKKL